VSTERVPENRDAGAGEEQAEEERARQRIAELLGNADGAGDLDGEAALPGSDAADGRRRRRHRSGHRSGHRSHHRPRHRLTPRAAKLKWWHVLLVVAVGLLVTWMVVAIVSGPIGPPPE